MFGKEFCHFFISALHYLIKNYRNFLNLTKFVSQHLIATHGHFHRHQFLTANYIFIWPLLSYLAVATATWEHWLSDQWHRARPACNGALQAIKHWLGQAGRESGISPSPFHPLQSLVQFCTPHFQFFLMYFPIYISSIWDI